MRNHLKEAIEFGPDLVTDDWRDREIESNEFDTKDMDEDELNTMHEEGEVEDDNIVDTSLNYCECFCHQLQAEECDYCTCFESIAFYTPQSPDYSGEDDENNHEEVIDLTNTVDEIDLTEDTIDFIIID